MTPEQNSFIRNYLEMVINGEAAVFAGAGLSVGEGFVDWRGLLREIADDLGLEVSKETDLISLAQFHYNENNGRDKINRKILNEFSEKAAEPKNHNILARLPIRTYWTTNYDSLIEDALEQFPKRVDVKHSVEQLTTPLDKRDAVVYKMHGDAKHPGDAIITKDDYESYHRKYEAFVTTLSADLISKTFLFLGFSFTDPNLDYIFSRVRLSLLKAPRQHFCIIKRVSKKGYKRKADFEYDTRRQQLMIADLNRFKIKAVVINDYPEITTILEEIERRYKRRTIFISGSAADYAPHTEERGLEFVHELSRQLVKKGYSVVNGFGLGIGSAVINGALDAIYNSPHKLKDDQLIMRPFPQIKTGTRDKDALKQTYRKKMISFAGIAIFIFGNKMEGGKIENALGVRDEFDIAIEQGVLPIPIGITGSMAKELWNEVEKKFSRYFPELQELKKSFQSLGNDKTSLSDSIKIVISMISTINQ